MGSSRIGFRLCLVSMVWVGRSVFGARSFGSVWFVKSIECSSDFDVDFSLSLWFYGIRAFVASAWAAVSFGAFV